MATSVNVATATSGVLRVAVGSGPSIGTAIVVAGAGDLNGDGFADIAIGLPNAAYSYVDNYLKGGDGAAYVIFGKASLPTSQTLAGLNPMSIPGALDFEKLGAALAPLGDVNGDGVADLLIAAPGAYANANTYPGGTFKNYDDPAAGYVIYGDTTPPAQLLTSTLDFALTGKSIASENTLSVYDTKGLGTTVAGLGDIDGDGLGDFALSRPQGYVQTYTNDSGSYTIGDTVTQATLVVASSGGKFWIDRAGEAASTNHVAAAGDVNNDGKDDFIVGNKLVFGRGNTAFGNTTFANLGATFTTTTLNSGTVGTTVRRAGDINGDGFDDLVGISGASVKLTNGAANGVGTTKTLTLPSGLTKVVFAGAAGDINNDNVDDLLIVGSQASGAGAQAYVIFGKTGGIGAVTLATLGTAGLTITGFGSAVLQSASAAGDVDKDNYDDLVFGLLDPNTNALSVTVVFGKVVVDTAGGGGSGGGGSGGGGSGGGGSGGGGSGGGSTGVGTGGSDTLSGSAGAETMSGAGGNDTLRGAGGDDWLYGGDGDDWLDGGIGADVIVAGLGNDWGEPSDGNDSMWGQDGADTLNGGAGDDKLFGNGDGDQLFGGTGADQAKSHAGDDTVMGEGGNDVLFGGAVNDSIDGGGDNDTVNGNSGSDTVNGGSGDDVVRGQGGPDSLLGGDGNDLLLGMAGFDTLKGEAGNDTLIGGDANDTLIGGPGADVFSFAAGHGTDVVNDFEDGIDRLQIVGVSSLAGLTITSVGGNAHIAIDGDSSPLPLHITLIGISPGQLSAADFIFG